MTDTQWLVLATFLLVLATSALVINGWRDQAERRRATQELENQAASLAASAEALAASAKANQAVADEMLEARKDANPLSLKVTMRENMPGAFRVNLHNDGMQPAIIRSTELRIGQGPDQRAPIDQTTWGNLYLGPGGSPHPISYDFPTKGGDGDLLVLRVVGRPKDGLEQEREFLFRLQPSGTLEDLATVHWVPPGTRAGEII